jgi:type III secretion system YscQ/HrcQ family protein
MEITPPDRLSHFSGSGTASRARLFSALPRLSATAVAARNRAYANAPCFLSDERVLIWQDTGPIRTIGELNCKVAEAPLAIAADSLSRIEPRLEGFESFVPTETCTALVEHALSPVITLLERLAGVPVDCEEFRRGPALSGTSDEVTVGFLVHESSMQVLLRGWVRTTPEAWQAMDFNRALSLNSRRHLAIPACLSVEFGRCKLSARDIKSLAPGDALRPTNRLLSDSSSMRVLLTDTSGKFCLAARISDYDLHMEHMVTANMDTPPSFMSSLDGSDGSSFDGDNDLLNEIECDMSFELGSLRMSVAEIGNLRAGQTIRLGVRLQEQPVRLLVNGRQIGRGELAAIGDELVVVITDTSRLAQV